MLLKDLMVQMWPLAPAPESVLNPPQLFEAYDQAVSGLRHRVGDQHQGTLLEIAQHMYDAETDRRSAIETRAGVVVGAAGLLGSLVVAAGQLAVTRTAPHLSLAGWIMVVFYILSLAYFALAVVAALGAQGSREEVRGNVIDPTDLTPSSRFSRDEKGAYDLQLAKTLLRYTTENYKVDNLLTYRLRGAQRCLRNAVLAILVAGVLAIWGARPQPAGTARPGNASASQQMHAHGIVGIYRMDKNPRTESVPNACPAGPPAHILAGQRPVPSTAMIALVDECTPTTNVGTISGSNRYAACSPMTDARSLERPNR